MASKNRTPQRRAIGIVRVSRVLSPATGGHAIEYFLQKRPALFAFLAAH
jgi:hypothetical protein